MVICPLNLWTDTMPNRTDQSPFNKTLCEKTLCEKTLCEKTLYEKESNELAIAIEPQGRTLPVNDKSPMLFSREYRDERDYGFILSEN